MSSREELKLAREKLNEVLFFSGHKPVDFVIKDIGYDWQPMIPEWKDQIKAIDSGDENVSIYIYKSTDIEIEFPPHFHKNNAEIILVLEGQVEVSTPHYTKILKSGDVHVFKKGEPHSAKFNTHTKIQLTYSPSFQENKWSASKSNQL